MYLEKKEINDRTRKKIALKSKESRSKRVEGRTVFVDDPGSLLKTMTRVRRHMNTAIELFSMCSLISCLIYFRKGKSSVTQLPRTR